MIEALPAIIVSLVEVEKFGVNISVISFPIFSVILSQNSLIKSSLYLLTSFIEPTFIHINFFFPSKFTNFFRSFSELILTYSEKLLSINCQITFGLNLIGQ